MSRFKVISKDSQLVRYEGAPQYNGAYLGVDYIEFRSISSSKIIDWEIGDYVDYHRTGKRYKLYSLPTPNKVARKGEYGASFEYSNIQLHSAAMELKNAPFRDIVPEDNSIHFSTRPEVFTYEDVYGIARRIQECMDDIFPNRWRIDVIDTSDNDVLSLLKETKEYSISNGSCLDALSQIYETWKNIGWIHTYDDASGKDVITIGRANVRDADNTSDEFSYGKGNGLTSIRKASANKDEFATRLYVYGSGRNIQPRYYNNFDIYKKDSVDIRNLMIPKERWGTTDGLPDAKKAYLQADESIIAKYGLIPRTVYFDGSENEEIFPSIKGLTERKVREYMIAAGQENSPYLPLDSEDRIDQIAAAEFEMDGGSKEDVEANRTFAIFVRRLGFDIVEQGKLTSEGKATITFVSGPCAGRTFTVLKCQTYENSQFITLERDWDESVGMGYPNKNYPILIGNEFVILDIPLPDYYITLAEDRLYEAGAQKLADYTRISAFYEPRMDSIAIKEGGKILTPGMFMRVYDEDIIDTTDNTDYVLIDPLSIDESNSIPSYQVTLREQKRSARTYSALEDMVADAKETSRREVQKVKQYTERRFNSALETLQMLQGAIEGFTDGISPVTVQTMALLVGDQALQFKFTKSTSSLDPVPCPVSYNAENKKLTCASSAIVHMTLGINEISSTRSTDPKDYFTRKVSAYSATVTDTDAFYVYVRASRVLNSASIRASKTPIGMEDEASYYNFLVGVMTSEVNNSREFVPLYGFTEILPSQVTTNIIRSANGKLVIDLENAIITASDGATIEGSLTIGTGSKGLSNLSEWSNAESKIDNAQKTANSASTTATTANTLASEAKRASETATANASSALNKAESASSEASQASASAQSATSTANSALSLAGTANTNATNASTAAGEAKTAAQTATTKAEEAKSTSTTALVNSQAAFETAGTASETATTALGKAQEAEAAASEATSLANEAKAAVTLINTSVTNLDTKIGNIASGVEESIKEINDKLDGVVESFFEPYTPSRTNLPASEWIANGTEEDHIGDTFTNTSTTGDDAGKSWRWLKQSDGSYDWQQIADSDAAKALLLASQAQTAADGKSKTFVSQPVPPYKEGDLWVQGGSGDIMRCKDGIDRKDGVFREIDWEKASKYTDDTKALAAQETANAAKATLDELTADGVITPFEYEFFFTELANVNYDRHSIQLDVERYGIEDSAEYASYAQFAEFYFADLLEINGGNPPMPVPSGLIWHRNGYYGHLGTIRDLIAAAAKQEVENAQSAANRAEDAVSEMNNDQYITHSEKRSLRAIVKKISSYEGISLPTSGAYTGEIHDWINIARQKVDDEVTVKVEEAYDAACDVFALAYGPMDLGSDGITDLGEGSNARQMFQDCLTAYYTAINVLVNIVPVSDYEYLKAALGNTASLDVEGVVLSQMMGVKDASNNKVRALLNGSDVGEDTEHGKLMLAAGIPTDGTIANKISEATTRIYEDGCMFSKNLHLEDGCTIGDMYISENGIKFGQYTDDDFLRLSGGSIMAKNKSLNGNSQYIQIGGCSGYALSVNSNSGPYCILADKEIALNVDAPNGYAIFARDGMFAGLRPKVRTITSSSSTSDKSLTYYDHTIIVNNSSAITLTLPDAPLEGQTYRILHTTTTAVTLAWNGNNAINVATGTAPGNPFSARRSVVLTYCGGIWYAEYINLSS